MEGDSRLIAKANKMGTLGRFIDIDHWHAIRNNSNIMTYRIG